MYWNANCWNLSVNPVCLLSCVTLKLTDSVSEPSCHISMENSRDPLEDNTPLQRCCGSMMSCLCRTRTLYLRCCERVELPHPGPSSSSIRGAAPLFVFERCDQRNANKTQRLGTWSCCLKLCSLMKYLILRVRNLGSVSPLNLYFYYKSHQLPFFSSLYFKWNVWLFKAHSVLIVYF